MSATKFTGLAMTALRSNFTQLRHPYKLTFSITYLCQSRCQMCNIWTIKPKGELSLEEIKEFAKKNKYFKWVELSGGEPFLRSDMVEIVRAFKESCKGLYVLTMPTNSLCNREMELAKMEEILMMGIPRVVITISLDGYRELHDRIRGVPGNFDKAIAMFKGLQELKKRYRNLDMVFGYTMTRFNQGQLEKTYDEVKRLVPEITHNTFHINVGALSDIYYSNSSTGESILADRTVLSREIAGFISKREKTVRDVALIERAFLRNLVKYVQTGEMPMKGRSLDASLFMDSYGNIYPSIMWGRKIGGIRESGYSLEPLWHNKEAKTVRALIKEGKEPKCWTACEAYQTLVGNVKSLI